MQSTFISGEPRSFISGGKPVEYIRYEPRREGKFPALLVLHGSNGQVSSFVGDYAQQLAELGYVVYFVHYFDRTSTTYATPTLIHSHFPAWMETIADAIAEAERDAKVEQGTIGLLGISLGGFLAMAVASREPRVAAVVSLMGGIPDYFAEHCRRMPATLLLHGEADTVVPVAEAYKAERLLKAVGATYELKVYPKQGHRFEGLSQLDVLTRTLRFLGANLKPAAKAAVR